MNENKTDYAINHVLPHKGSTMYTKYLYTALKDYYKRIKAPFPGKKALASIGGSVTNNIITNINGICTRIS